MQRVSYNYGVGDFSAVATSLVAYTNLSNLCVRDLLRVDPEAIQGDEMSRLLSEPDCLGIAPHQKLAARDPNHPVMCSSGSRLQTRRGGSDGGRGKRIRPCDAVAA